MTDIDKLLGGTDIRKAIDNAYTKGNHLQWIFLMQLWFETLLRTFLYSTYSIREYIKLNSEMINYISQLKLSDLEKYCYFEGIITKETHDKIHNFRKGRNKIQHRLFSANTKIEKIDVETLYSVGKSALDSAGLEFLDYYRIKLMSNKVSKDIISKLKTNLSE